MIKLIVKWVLFALVIMAVCYLPGLSVESFWYAMLVAAILTLVNIFIKPVIKLLTFPINLLTLGLFNFLINIGILYAVAYFVKEFDVENFFSAFIASLIIAISYSIIRKV